jgi:hypothetical protein
VVIPEVAQSIKQHYLDCIKAGHAIEYGEQRPSPYLDLDRIRTFHTTISPVFDQNGKIVRLVGATEDITDQKAAEKILMENARKEAISAQRSRLTRELHYDWNSPFLLFLFIWKSVTVTVVNLYFSFIMNLITIKLLI